MSVDYPRTPPGFVWVLTHKPRAALSLPLGQALQKLDQLQRLHDAGRLQSAAAIRDVADALRLLPQVELQISGLTQKFENFVVGVESKSQAQASKEEAESDCEWSYPKVLN